MARDLTEGGIVKTILVTSLPMVFAFLLHSAFNLVDAYFVGQLSAEALAAVSVGFPVVFMMIALASGLGVGTTSLIARKVGKKDIKGAGEAAEHALLMAVVLVLFFTVAGLLSAGTLFDMMGIEAEVKELALEYINIILLGSVAMFLAMTANSIIRGEGEMMFPMAVMGFAAILNMVLDPIFIFDLGLGVRGAALATVISRVVGLSILAGYIIQERTWVRLKFHRFRFNMSHVKGILSVGIPQSLSNFSMSVGIFLLTIIVADFGTEAIAAFGIGFRLDSIALLPGLGVMMAVVSLVGQNVGAGRYDRAEEMTIKAGVMAVVFMSAIGLFFFLFSEQIVSVFNSDPLVVAYGSSMLRILPLSYLLMGLGMAVSGAFMGSGHARPALAITFLRVIVLSVPLAYVLSRSMGVEGIWLGIMISSIIASVIGIAWFRRGSWKNR